jgi:glutamate synthase domain-containing protein 3
MSTHDRVTFTIPKKVNEHLEKLTDLDDRKKSNIVARLIERHYNLMTGGIGAKQMLDDFDDAILELKHNNKISTDTYVMLKKYIDQAQKELMEIPEIKKFENEKIAKLKERDRQIMETNKKIWEQEDKNKK